MVEGKARSARSCLAAAVLVTLLLLPAHPAAGLAGTPTCSGQVFYRGRDKADIAYTFDGDGTPVTLEAVHASAGTRTFAGPAISGSANTRLDNLEPGLWIVRLSTGETCFSFPIDGEITGTPLFDETITGGSTGNIAVSTDAQSGSFQISNATIQGYVSVNNSAGATKITIANNLIGSIVTLSGRNISLSGNQLLAGVSLPQRTNALIQGNVLADAITLGSKWDEEVDRPVCGNWCEEGPDPLITGNSFVGRYALRAPDATSFWKEPAHPGDPTTIAHPIPAGCNFYGSPLGYTVDPSIAGGAYQELPFLAYTGAYVDTLRFYAECRSGEGQYLRPDIFPQVWAEGWIAGQNVLLHANRSFVPVGWALTDRQTLLSVDVRSTRETLQGARFYVMFNGQRVDSLPANVRRWYSSYLGKDGFEKTVNFILPAIPPSSAEVVPATQCLVYADLSGVSGAIARPADTTLLLAGCSMQFVQPPEDLKILVYPVDVVGTPGLLTGSCSGRANMAGVYAAVPNDFAAMFPIRTQDIRMAAGPRAAVECGPLTSLTSAGLWTQINASLAINGAITGRHASYDRVIAVLPWMKGYSIEGANSAYNRNLLLVQDSTPEAAVHEMGHTLGLVDNYTGWPSFKDGELLYGLTAFDPDLSGRYDIAPGKHFWANEPLPDTYDIMGATSAMWPNKMSYQFFQRFLSPPSPPAEDTAAAGVPSAPTGRTVFFSANMIFDERSGGYYEMDLDKASLFDLSGTGLNPESSPDLPWGDRNGLYWLEAFDAAGERVFQQYFVPDDYWGYPAYYHALAVPVTAERIELRNNVTYGFRVWTKDKALAATLLSPQPGAVLTGTLTLAWEQSSEALEHLVLYSTDGGATWDAVSPPFTGDRVELGTEFLPSGTPISLRVLTSDGFQHVETRVDNLTLANRPPIVSIRSPSDGAQAEPGFAWRLAGVAGDYEDQSAASPRLPAGHWTSSRDGALGAGSTLLNVVLSPGTHVLTFAAEDSKGLAAQRQVTVTVAPVTQVDLALDDDSLALLAPGSDAWIQGRTPYIAAGVTNTVRAQLTGPGVPLTATLAISASVPGQPARLLGRSTLAMAPFAVGEMVVAFHPGDQKPWRLTAAIEAATLPDPNPANNTRTWEYTTRLPWGLFLPAVKGPP